MQTPFNRLRGMAHVATNWPVSSGRPSQAGVTLIDTIVGTALMLVVFLGISAAFQLTIEVVSNSKARAGAIALANERMEYLKSLSYSQVGVLGGIPAGIVPQLETVTLNGVSYTRRTLVYYSDDPADGSGALDTNAIIADYKTIRVEISWMTKRVSRSIQTVGRMSPQGIETAVPGGILTINVVDANNAPLQDAQIDITNTSTTPTVSIRTYTNDVGSITFIGAPASSQYQIVVSKTGYSTARTYSVTAQNVNPNPRHLTVSNNLTTSYTFAIDVLADKTIQTFKAIEARTWTDPMSAGTYIATTSNVALSGGSALLEGTEPYAASGFVLSTDITTALLNRWMALVWTDTTPAQTDIRYSLYTMQGGEPTLIPDSALPGNAAGFTDSPVDLTELSITTYPSVRIGATLTTMNASTTPALDSWGISYRYGPEVLPNLSVTMQGLKTIGNSPTIWKYNATSTSNSSGEISLPQIEWDTYTVEVSVVSGYETAEVCNVQPELLAPGTSQLTRIYVATNTPKTLLVDVRRADGTYIEDATITLTASSTNQTSLSSACGQSFFRSLNGGSGYTLVVSKTGLETSTTSETVIGDTRRSITLEP